MSTRLPKILLVGDLDDSCTAAKKLLSQMTELAVDVASFSNGTAALEAIGKGNFESCLLLAYLAPGEEKRILAEAGKLKSPTPVVVLSDRDNEHSESGLTEYLSGQEASAKSLERAVRNALKRAEAVRKMLALSEELELKVSELEANKLDVQILEFPPLTLVEGSAQLMVSSARLAQLQLFTFVDPDLPSLLRGDPLRLRQILLNLLSNAIKFTKAGEVVIRAIKQSEDSNTVKVRFEVTDSGPGLSEERQKELFSPLAERARAGGRYGRTELGLSICRRLVQLMDGQIGVESQPGQGSTFWFSVALERSANVAPGSKGLLSTIASDLRGISVLLVDPNKTSQEILKSYLQAAGITTTTTRSATESMALLLKQARTGSAFDVAIVNPKGSQGQELSMAKKAGGNQLLSSTAFVLVCDEDDMPACEKLNEAGFAGCLPRPVKQLQLVEQVTALAGRQSASATEQAEVAAGQNQEGPDKPAAGQVGATEKSERRKSLRVLLAEDNHVLRELAALQLRRLGISAVTVADGKEALARLTAGDFDLVFLDCQMPEIDGYELTRQIREREAGGDRHLPIIAMTASILPGDRERCLAAGMDDYLSKPINRQQLDALIRRWSEPGGSSEPANKLEDRGRDHPESDPIDLAKVKLFYGEKALPGLIKAFFNEAAQLVDNLRDAAKEKDLDEVMTVAHKMKGLALSFEVHRMVALVGEIERAAQGHQWLDIERILVNISKVLQTVAQSLQRFLSDSQA